jgi:hypothetical protein
MIKNDLQLLTFAQGVVLHPLLPFKGELTWHFCHSQFSQLQLSDFVYSIGM